MKVRLTMDLTKYHPSLEVGATGTALGPYGKRSQQKPKVWVGVEFEHHTLDVLRKHLEAIKDDEPVGPSDGPVLPIRSDLPPKVGQIVEFAGVEFKVDGLVERLGEDIWLVSLRSL